MQRDRDPHDPGPASPPRPADDRPLGIVEAIVAVRDQCPNGAVRAVAERALAEIGTRRPGVVREQALVVLAAIQGWRSERARRVHASLSAFLESGGESGS